MKSSIKHNKYSAFSYKPGNSFLHKCPAWVKLLFIPALSIAFLCLPIYFAVGLIVVQTILAFGLGFSVKEQSADLKPVLYYAFFVVLMDLLNWAGSAGGDSGFCVESFAAFFSWKKQRDSFFMLVKIFAVLQSASLVFKTSTSLELREGIWQIEKSGRKIFHLKEKNVLTNAISMFLNFIPMVAKIWEQSKRSWLARGGKKGIRMYLKLLPVLFFVGMKKAYNAARAIAARDL